MKIIRNIVIALVALVAIVLVATYMMVATYDREEMKIFAQTQTKEMTGRDLVINGPLEISISLRPAIVLEDVTFSNASWGSRTSMVTMKRFELAISLIDILSGQLRVNRFTLVEPDILLETDRRGNGNWDLPIMATDTSDDTEQLIGFGGADNISISGGTLTYRDGATGDALVLNLNSVEGSLAGLSSGSIKLKGGLDGTSLALSANIGGENDEYTLSNMSLTYGETNLKGSGSLSLSGKPTLKANLSGGLLDLSPLMTPGADMSTDEETVSQFVFTTEPFPVEGLRAMNVTATISADKVKVSEAIMVTDMTMNMSLKDGDLRLGNLGGKAFGGTVSGDLSLSSRRSPARMQATLTIADLDYGTVLKAFDISEDVNGNISMNIDVNGQGNSPRAMASSLNGSSEVIALDGIITNQLLAVVASGLDNIMKPLLGGANSTKLNCFVSRISMQSGRAVSKDFVVDSPVFSVAGEGTIDLRDESIDLLFDTNTREAALVSLAIPFRVKGTLANPKAALDPMATVDAAAKLFGSFSGDSGGDDAISGLLGGFFGSKKKKEPEPQQPEEVVDICTQLGVK